MAEVDPPGDRQGGNTMTDQIDKDIEEIKGFLKYRSCGIRTAQVYDVYERYGFLDPQHDSPESAIEALELIKYEKRERLNTNRRETGKEGIMEIEIAVDHSDYSIEKYEGTQVGYVNGRKNRTRKVSGFKVTDPDGYERIFNTKKEAQAWVDKQKPAECVAIHERVNS